MIYANEINLPQWARDAVRFPIRFAQVREDSLLDLKVIARLSDGPIRVAMIGSGGCTAAALAASNRVASIDLIDANPAQLALCRFKLHLVKTATTFERMWALGHAPMNPEDRANLLNQSLERLELPADSLGPLPDVAVLGPDYAGRYELLFAALRDEFREHSAAIEQLLKSRDAIARSRQVISATPFRTALSDAFDRAMALPILEYLFSPEATRNSVMPFARHFKKQTVEAIAITRTWENPYLWQVLVGRFPKGATCPWLTMAAPQKMPEIRQRQGTMNTVLESADESEFDFVHVSNILDWLSAEQASRTLQLACRALRPGGLVFARQLNSSIDIPNLGGQFEWLNEITDRMLVGDRSYFYRQLHLGMKR